MAEGFVTNVSELESALAVVESSLRGPELSRARALVAAVMEVHRIALQDLRHVIGDAELGRAAAREPSVAWLLACHEIDATELERAVSAAEAKQAHAEEVAVAKAESFVPVSRLLRRESESTP